MDGWVHVLHGLERLLHKVPVVAHGDVPAGGELQRAVDDCVRCELEPAAWGFVGVVPISLPAAFRKALVHFSFLGFLFILNYRARGVSRWTKEWRSKLKSENGPRSRKSVWRERRKRLQKAGTADDVRSYDILSGRI